MSVMSKRFAEHRLELAAAAVADRLRSNARVRRGAGKPEVTYQMKVMDLAAGDYAIARPTTSVPGPSARLRADAAEDRQAAAVSIDANDAGRRGRGPQPPGEHDHQTAIAAAIDEHVEQVLQGRAVHVCDSRGSPCRATLPRR